jgi:hypothetical protein
MADANVVTELRPSPAKGEVPHKPKDPTAALRARRARRKRKAVAAATLPVNHGEIPHFEKPSEIKPSVTVERHSGRGVTLCTTVAALALATVSAGFSITGLTSIFVGAFWPVIGMGVALELGKLSAVARLGQAGCFGEQRSHPARPLKAAIVTLIAVLMGLNAVGAYGFLARAHIGHQVAGDITAEPYR